MNVFLIDSSMKNKMILTLQGIVERKEKHVLSQDERRRMNYVIASYRDNEGFEYRKSFSSYTEPIVPVSGTHAELNSLEVQL